MKRYHIYAALTLVLVFALVLPGMTYAQGGGDDTDSSANGGEGETSAGSSSALRPETNVLENRAPDEDGRGAAAAASNTIVINEIWTGGTDGVELYNKTPSTWYNLANWTIFIYDSTATQFSFTFPSACWIGPGEVFRVYEGTGTTNCANNIAYLGAVNIFWVDNSAYNDGAVSLRNSGGTSIDFMRFGGSSTFTGDWAGFNPLNGNAATSRTLQREVGGADNDLDNDWCVAFTTMNSPNSVSCPVNTVRILEVDPGTPDGIEIYNAGNRNVNLVGTILDFNWTTGESSFNNNNLTYVMTDMDLLQGQRIVVREGTGVNGPQVQYIGSQIGWADVNPDGFAQITRFGFGDTFHDAVSFGNVDLLNYTYSPMMHISGRTLQKETTSSTFSWDYGDLWCTQLPTMGSSNWACPADADIVINEVDTGTSDGIEIYNAGGRAVNIRKSHVDIIQFSSLAYTYNFGNMDMTPGKYVEILEFSGTDDFNTVYTGQNIDWSGVLGGAELRDNGNNVGDFIRYRDTTYNPLVTSWSGTLPALNNSANSWARSPNAFDTNSASNWCEQPNSFLSANSGCLVEPLVASVTCVHPNLHVTITSGDGPFNITATEGQNMPVIGVGTGTTIVVGPDRWRDVTVTETTGDNQSSILTDRIICRSTQDTILQWPPHRSRTTDTTPFFNWTDTTDANLYRIFIFDNKVQADRLVDVRQNNSISQWTASPPLPIKRLFWRARARVNSAWGFWSVRWTLFIDPAFQAQEAVAAVPGGNDLNATPEMPVPYNDDQVSSDPPDLLAPDHDAPVVVYQPPSVVSDLPADVTGLMSVEAESNNATAAGLWSMRGTANASGSTMLISSGQPSDMLTVTFTGDRFGIQYGTMPSGGTLTVMIDEVFVGTIDTSDTTDELGLKVFGLANGNHTARLFSNDGVIAIDALYVESLIAPPSSASASDEGNGATGDGTDAEGDGATGDGTFSQQAPVTTNPISQETSLPAAPNAR